MGKDSIIILSGRLDSTTLLYDERQRIALAITFNYGSNHAQREIECATYHCRKLGIEHLVIDLDFVRQHFRSSLIDGVDAIPDGSYDESNMHSTVVPFRNGIMLSIACGLAESRGLKRVLIANHSGDHDIYPDCRSRFIRAMAEVMRAGTYADIELAAPYTDLEKSELVLRGARYGVDFAHTYSCYRGGEVHCGRCGTCRERREAFVRAGIPDPTEYEK